jgi:hypothetical protein
VNVIRHFGPFKINNNINVSYMMHVYLPISVCVSLVDLNLCYEYYYGTLKGFLSLPSFEKALLEFLCRVIDADSAKQKQ